MANKPKIQAPVQATAPVVTGNPGVDAAVVDVKNAMTSVAGLIGTPLTAVERLHLTKVRRNGQQLIGLYVNLANQIPQLVPVGVSPQALSQQFQQYQDLVVLKNVVNSAAQAVGGAVARAEAELWASTLSIYGIASHSIGNNAQVAEAVAQMKVALANGPHYSKETGLPIKKSSKSKKSTSAAPAPTQSAAPVASTSPTTASGPATGSGNGSSTSVPVFTPNGGGKPEGS